MKTKRSNPNTSRYSVDSFSRVLLGRMRTTDHLSTKKMPAIAVVMEVKVTVQSGEGSWREQAAGARTGARQRTLLRASESYRSTGVGPADRAPPPIAAQAKVFQCDKSRTLGRHNEGWVAEEILSRKSGNRKTETVFRVFG